MIFVAVGQQDGVDRSSPERREVGRDPIDTRKSFVRKRHTDIQHEVRAAAREPEHVASELAQAAERNERDFRAGRHGASSPAASAT